MGVIGKEFLSVVVKIKFSELCIIGTLDGPGGHMMDYLMWTCRDQGHCYLFLRVLSQTVENNWFSGTAAKRRLSTEYELLIMAGTEESGLNARIMVGYK